jgi:hypothetical protein
MMRNFPATSSVKSGNVVASDGSRAKEETDGNLGHSGALRSCSAFVPLSMLGSWPGVSGSRSTSSSLVSMRKSTAQCLLFSISWKAANADNAIGTQVDNWSFGDEGRVLWHCIVSGLDYPDVAQRRWTPQNLKPAALKD